MQGIKLEEISRAKRDYEQSLVDLVSEESDFLADPMPNLYFTEILLLVLVMVLF